MSEPHVIRRFKLDTPDGEKVIEGRILGYSTSKRDSHNHAQNPPPHGWKCSACRWVELTLYKVVDGTFAVYTRGCSSLPGESDRTRLIYTESPYEVVELMTDRRGATPRLPMAAAKVLAQAAHLDSGINEAYINRAVA